MSQTQFDDSITLVIEDRKIQCSKELLMLKSDYFRVMFSHNYRECNEKIITLEGVDGKAMEDLLQVLLNMTHYRNISDICKVILLSDMFLFDDLKEKLIQETTKSLSLKNCLQIWLKLELMPTIPLVWKAKSHSRNDYLTKIITLESNQLHDLVGFEVQVYKKKIYIFGGEFSIGKGIWNDRFWHCNIERKKLNTKCGTPIKRRHFKSCVAGGFLYIIGGTGKYRIRKNDMLHFNFKSEKWGTDVVQLPCCPTSLKYCAFNEKLFILDCHSKLGYFYVNDKNNWLSVNIAHTVNLDDVSSLSIFSYRGHLFMKGKKLVELEYINDTLQPIKVHDIPNYTDGVLIETLNSYNRVYSTYADPITGIVSLEYLNLDDLTSVFFNSVGLLDPNQPSETTQLLKYNPNLEIKMFMCHHDILAFHEDILVDD
ncbi:uncharacterized protein LOC123676315 isoform X5 [Harmonia axyridis]|uniref:uncharacterized protein LOC123676315 isoform X5 n=1 Tax=Harmonia axyridis TaxID=115357 RepID=UPI001E2790CD|nr:uncharacterized protein LOC123676315 isoform X5 [Harmonia axyridis]